MAMLLWTDQTQFTLHSRLKRVDGECLFHASHLVFVCVCLSVWSGRAVILHFVFSACFPLFGLDCSGALRLLMVFCGRLRPLLVPQNPNWKYVFMPLCLWRNMYLCPSVFTENLFLCPFVFTENLFLCPSVFTENLFLCPYVFKENTFLCTYVFTENMSLCSSVFKENMSLCPYVFAENMYLCTYVLKKSMWLCLQSMSVAPQSDCFHLSKAVLLSCN